MARKITHTPSRPPSGPPPVDTKTTLAVERDVADRVRAEAQRLEVPTHELATKLLAYALQHAQITVQRVEVSVKMGK